MSNASSHILIIDDDPDLVTATKITLEAHRFQVDTAPDTKQGLKKIQENPPALIILDIMMEGMAAGIIFARELRRNPQTAKTPILMLTGMTEQTGFSFPGEVKDPKWLPVDDYVEKPIDPETLVQKVKALLAKKV